MTMYVQIASLEIEPSCLDDYKAAVKEQIETAVRTEPGVLALHAVADKDHPGHITVFEIYRDQGAYEAHLQTAHFLAYKAKVETMVRSLTLTRVSPVGFAAKPLPLL